MDQHENLMYSCTTKQRAGFGLFLVILHPQPFCFLPWKKWMFSLRIILILLGWISSVAAKPTCAPLSLIFGNTFSFFCVKPEFKRLIERNKSEHIYNIPGAICLFVHVQATHWNQSQVHIKRPLSFVFKLHTCHRFNGFWLLCGIGGKRQLTTALKFNVIYLIRNIVSKYFNAELNSQFNNLAFKWLGSLLG